MEGIFEITFKYNENEGATFITNGMSYPTPTIYPPIYKLTVNSFEEKSGSVKFGDFNVDSVKVIYLGTEGNEEKFEICNSGPSRCIFEKRDNTTYLNILVK